MRARRPKDPEPSPETKPASFGGGGGLSATGFLADVAKKRPGVGGVGRMSDLDAAIRRASDRAKTGDWSDATGEHLVGLYALMHQSVHQTRPLELEQKGEFTAARSAASRALRDLFKKDASKMVEFMKWTWSREKERSTWARNNGRDHRRMSWRLQFSRSFVTDYATHVRTRSRTRS